MSRHFEEHNHMHEQEYPYEINDETTAFGVGDNLNGALETHTTLVVDYGVKEREINDGASTCCLRRRGKFGPGRRAVVWSKLRVPVLVVLLVGFLVYVGAAVYLHPTRAVFICVLTTFVAFALVNVITRGKLAKCMKRLYKRLERKLKVPGKVSVWMRRLSTIAAVLGIVAFLVVDIWDDFKRWQPLGGLALFIVISVIFSKHPSKINWMSVIWGLILQFYMGLVILRWRLGFQACRWMGSQVTTFLDYTDKGSEFVFGDKYLYHPIIFKILPVVIFYSAVVSCLYYVGAMQAIIKYIAVAIQFAMKTTPIESFATAAQIFIGMVECSVTLRPFFPKLTFSEINAIMTSGYATVAGTVIAAYVEFGVAPEHVISASFMSAPAALAIAKLSIPETEQSQIKTFREIKVPKGQETNLIDALSVGATTVIKLIAYIVVNLIAFISVLAFLDAILSYLGGLVNYPELSFQLISSYVFMPLAAAMGVPWSETRIVGTLIGKKIVINEFLAFADLGTMIKDGVLSEKSSVLATYILCGFGSIAALGINLGCLSSSCPERRADFAKLSVRTLINGNIACFMTACIAGLLYQDFSPDSLIALGSNTTMNSNSTIANITEQFIA